MKTLQELTKQDARLWKNTKLLPEQFRAVLGAAIRPFREATKRDALPFTIVNDPGVLQSRHINVVDIGAADHGMEATGGSYDRVDQTPVDNVVYAIWKNVQVPWRHGLAAERGGFDILSESGVAAGEKITELENRMFLSQLGPVTGLTKATGIQTFAGATWGTAGNAYKDIVRAVIKEFGTEKVPRNQAALLVDPAQEADLFTTFSNTDAAQLERIQRLLPGGIFSSPEVEDGKAYVYARTPGVLEYRVYQDLTVVPLPMVDEDERMRTRVIGAVHIKKPKGIVEITGVA